MFKRIVSAAMELFIPKVRLRSFQFPQWFSPELRHKFKCLRTMEGLCAKKPTQSKLRKLEVAEVEFRSLAESTKTSFEHGLINDFTSRETSHRGDIPSIVCNGTYPWLRVWIVWSPEPLHCLFVLSLHHHQLPSEWKLHGIKPIHKSGDRGTVSN